MDFPAFGHSKDSPVKITKEANPKKALMAFDYEGEESAKSSLEVLLVPDFHALDGRFANNGWMQECPHPITKLTWDNALLISPSLAKSLEEEHPNLGLLPQTNDVEQKRSDCTGQCRFRQRLPESTSSSNYPFRG